MLRVVENIKYQAVWNNDLNHISADTHVFDLSVSADLSAFFIFSPVSAEL